MAGIIVLWGRDPAAGDHPTARRFKVLIGSKVLWRHRAAGGSAASAAREALAWMVDDLWTVLPSSNRIRVRRVDVCMDHWGYEWSQRDLERFACRQNLRGLEVHREPDPTDEIEPDQVRTVYGANSATYYIGGHGAAARYLRIYNKIAEAMASGKMPWMEPLWRQFGWDGVQTVWRAEIEHGGEWLKAHGLETLDQLDGCEHALWREYLGDVRHTTGRSTRLKRSKTSRVWRRLGRSIIRAEREAEKAGHLATWKWQPRPPKAGGDMKVLTDVGAGCSRKIIDTMFDGDFDKFVEFMREAVERSRRSAQQRDEQRMRAAMPAGHPRWLQEHKPKPARDRSQPAPRHRKAVGDST